MSVIELRPQPGPQSLFLSTPADVVIYGGSAGGGKSYALLMEPLRHVHNPNFTAVIFRRNYPQIKNPGGLLSTSYELFPLLGGVCKESSLDWYFPSGARISFRQLQYNKSVHDYQGAQFAFIAFDELTHFEESQFWYMFSRNRSMSGVKPYIRATTNPDSDSWVRGLIEYYLNADGYADMDKKGEVRYFSREGGELSWVDKDFRDSLGLAPKSFCFIPSSIFDNQALLAKDPGYLANLNSMPLVERERLLGGNWNIRATGGKIFNRAWIEIIDHIQIPANAAQFVRYWDFAATEKENTGEPDYTVGVLMAFFNGCYYILSMVAVQAGPPVVKQLVKNMASHDGKHVVVRWEQEGGASGKQTSYDFAIELRGWDAAGIPSLQDKLRRAAPLSAEVQRQNVKIVRSGYWDINNGELAGDRAINAFLNQLEAFPDNKLGSAGYVGFTAKKDAVDGSSGAYNALNEPSTMPVVGSYTSSR